MNHDMKTELFGRWGQHVMKTPQLIIGIGHMRNVGKDVAKGAIHRTFVEHIGRKYGAPEFPRVHAGAFADPLYSVCNDLYGWAGMKTKAYYDTDRGRVQKERELPLLGKSPRQILIDVGMAIRNDVFNDTWVKRAMNTYGDVVILSDMRFPNEAQAIRDAGGVLIKIERPSLTVCLPSTDPDMQLNDWTDWDFTVINSDTLEGFERYVEDYTKDHLIPLWEKNNG